MDIEKELEKLKSLVDKGLITKEDYESKKNELLGAPSNSSIPSPTNINQPTQNEPKEWLVTLLLCFFVGVLGIHRFYTGHIGIGVAQLLTFGGCGIWALIDFILILVGSYKDAEGRPLKK